MIKNETKEKTHWLQNPNKNYLGHWDLPNGDDVVLEIESAKWEKVTNPITSKTESKRVIRFKEKTFESSEKKVKPFICNQINAQTILRITGEKFMEDCGGKRIKLGLGRAKMMGEEVDCIRVRKVDPGQGEEKKITTEQLEQIHILLPKAGKTEKEIKTVMKVKNLSDLPLKKFKAVLNRLEELSNETR